MGMMRVSLNLDDVANSVAKPWSVVVIMTVMIDRISLVSVIAIGRRLASTF